MNRPSSLPSGPSGLLLSHHAPHVSPFFQIVSEGLMHIVTCLFVVAVVVAFVIMMGRSPSGAEMGGIHANNIWHIPATTARGFVEGIERFNMRGLAEGIEEGIDMDSIISMLQNQNRPMGRPIGRPLRVTAPDPTTFHNSTSWPNDAECAICMESFEEGCGNVRKMPGCEHMFHINCIQSHINHRGVACPLCRASLVVNASPETVVHDDDPVSPSETSFGAIFDYFRLS
jgi:hypothetical protein